MLILCLMFAVADSRNTRGITLFRHTSRGLIAALHDDHPGSYGVAAFGINHIYRMEISEYTRSIYIRSYSWGGLAGAYEHPIYSFSSLVAESGGKPYIVSRGMDDTRIRSMDGTCTGPITHTAIGTTAAEGGKCYLIGNADRTLCEGFEGLAVTDGDVDYSTSIWTDGAVYAVLTQWQPEKHTFVRRDPRVEGVETLDDVATNIIGRATSGIIVCGTRDMSIYDVRACSAYDICPFDHSMFVPGTCSILG